jgi:hypothetical protein
MATSFERGWPTVFDHAAGVWRYSDTGEACDQKRQCRRCGRPPTQEGYDACIGYQEGLISVCCGHGIGTPIAVSEQLGDIRVTFWNKTQRIADEERRPRGGGGVRRWTA